MYKARYNHRIPHKVYLDLSDGNAIVFELDHCGGMKWARRIYMGEDWKWAAVVIPAPYFFDLLTDFGFIVGGKIVEDL